MTVAEKTVLSFAGIASTVVGRIVLLPVLGRIPKGDLLACTILPVRRKILQIVRTLVSREYLTVIHALPRLRVFGSEGNLIPVANGLIAFEVVVEVKIFSPILSAGTA